MNEFERLWDTFQFWKVEKHPFDATFPNLLDEGLCLKFIDAIREEDLGDQAFFLSELVKYRPICLTRLLELIKVPDENVQIFAYAGLLNTDLRNIAYSFLMSKCIERVINPELEEGDWPIGFILDYMHEIDDVRSLLHFAELTDKNETAVTKALRLSVSFRERNLKR